MEWSEPSRQAMKHVEIYGKGEDLLIRNNMLPTKVYQNPKLIRQKINKHVRKLSTEFISTDLEK